MYIKKKYSSIEVDIQWCQAESQGEEKKPRFVDFEKFHVRLKIA